MHGRNLAFTQVACAVALAALFSGAVSLGAESLSERLLIDAEDGRLDDFDFFSAALIASGIDEEAELSRSIETYRARRASILARASGSTVKLQQIHAALHKQLLVGGYCPDASDLRRTLARGEFNCLTSLVIYVDLCQAAGLRLEICALPAHVFVRTKDAFRIEPNNPDWTSACRQCSAGTDETGVRPISPVNLLGRFYYNRGVEMLKQGEFADGLDALEMSLRFDPTDADTRANLLAGINNWAVHFYSSTQYEAAEALIPQGLRIDPSFAPLLENQRLVRKKISGN